MSSTKSLLQQEFLSRGFDIFTELNTSWYNAIKPSSVVALPENRVAMLLGNSRVVWPHFLRFFQALKSPVEHPFDEFVAHEINSVISILPVEQRPEVFYVQDKSPTRLIAFQRLASVSGACLLLDEIHLCVHPVFGPWFALRALLVFEEPSLLVTPPATLNIPINEVELVQAARCLEEAMQHKDWKLWAKIRECITLGREYRYEESQLIYHYSKSQKVVQERVHNF